MKCDACGKWHDKNIRCIPFIIAKSEFLADMKKIMLKRLLGKLSDFDMAWNIKMAKMLYGVALQADKDFSYMIYRERNPNSLPECLEGGYEVRSFRQANIGSILQHLQISREKATEQS